MVTIKLKGDYFSGKHVGIISGLAKKRDVVLLGNGIGLRKETRQFAKKAVKKIRNNLVIDADGIKALSTADLENSIITPHIRELEIFMNNSGINKKIIKKIIAEKDIERKALMIRKAISLLGIKKNNRNFFENNNFMML